MGNKLIKSILIHVKYPYTAIVISIMWISMAIIIINQGMKNFDIIIIITAVCTLIIAAIGFKSPK